MSGTSPLEYLLERARRARDNAGRALADDRRAEALGEAQLQTLENYRREYSQRLQQALQQGVDNATLANYRRFIQSLDDAIGQARQALSRQQHRVSASRQLWQTQQRTLSSYDTLLTRRAAQQQRQQARLERRHDDELSAALLQRARHELPHE